MYTVWCRLGLQPPEKGAGTPRIPNVIFSASFDHDFSRGAIDVLAAIGPKVALHSLRVAFPIFNAFGAISFPQLNASFKDLVSLSLVEVVMHSTEVLILPRLKHLHLSQHSEAPPLPTQRWDLPRLQHVYSGIICTTTYFDTALDFLRRYGSQLESLFLIQYSPFNGLPYDLWDSFTALQLLGLYYRVLGDRGWSGWAIKPPRTHPVRYLACREFLEFENVRICHGQGRIEHRALASGGRSPETGQGIT